MLKNLGNFKTIFWKAFLAILFIYLLVGLSGTSNKNNNKRVSQNSFLAKTPANNDPDKITFQNASKGAVPEESISSRAELPVAVDSDVVENVEKKIIKNGQITLKVDEADKTAEQVKNIVKGFSGEVFSSNSFKNYKGNLQVSLIFKVPVDKFDEAMQAIKKVDGEVLSDSITTNDATAEYVDLQAQLKNKKLEEETFQKILTEAKNVDNILKVTKEISKTRGEIDRLEGRIKYLNSQTDMSRINVTITEFVKVTPRNNTWKPWRTVQQSLHQLLVVSENLVDGIIYFVIVKLPFLLVALFFFWLFVKNWSRIKNLFR